MSPNGTMKTMLPTGEFPGWKFTPLAPTFTYVYRTGWRGKILQEILLEAAINYGSMFMGTAVNYGSMFMGTAVD